MSGTTILLLGAGGQLGSALAEPLRALGEVTGLTRSDCDLSDIEAVRAMLRDATPDLIVNAAAYTGVDAAETDGAAAHRLNAELPATLAAHCAKTGARLVHYSSDYVFAGDGDRPVPEDRPMAPLGAYGRTKGAGDMAILESDANALILRPSWVYSANRPCFLTTMARLARERDTLSVVADQIGSPTPADWLARTTADLLRVYPFEEAEVVNCVPSGFVSWHGFTVAILDGLRQRGLLVRTRTVEPVGTEAFPRPAPRPRNSRLDTRKLTEIMGAPAPTWQIVLDPVLDLYAGLHAKES